MDSRQAHVARNGSRLEQPAGAGTQDVLCCNSYGAVVRHVVLGFGTPCCCNCCVATLRAAWRIDVLGCKSARLYNAVCCEAMCSPVQTIPNHALRKSVQDLVEKVRARACVRARVCVRVSLCVPVRAFVCVCVRARGCGCVCVCVPFAAQAAQHWLGALGTHICSGTAPTACAGLLPQNPHMRNMVYQPDRSEPSCAAVPALPARLHSRATWGRTGASDRTFSGRVRAALEARAHLTREI